MALVHNGSRAVTVSGDDLAVVWDLQVGGHPLFKTHCWCAAWRLLLSVGGLPLKGANIALTGRKGLTSAWRCVPHQCVASDILKQSLG